MASPLSVVLLGGGTVGSAVAQLLVEQAEDLTARIGRPLELKGVAVRDASKPRSGISAELITQDAAKLASSGKSKIH